MRRYACVVVAALLLAPAGLRLAAACSGPGAAEILCAIACGHGASPGAVCCPLKSERTGEPRWTACSGTGAAGFVSPPAAQPGVVPGRAALSILLRGAIVEVASAARPPALPPGSPDHVPRLLS